MTAVPVGMFSKFTLAKSMVQVSPEVEKMQWVGRPGKLAFLKIVAHVRQGSHGIGAGHVGPRLALGAVCQTGHPGVHVTASGPVPNEALLSRSPYHRGQGG